LAEFDEIFNELLMDTHNHELIEQCRNISDWLHTFSAGQQLQKRYIFTVVNKTMPIVSSSSSGGKSRAQSIYGSSSSSSGGAVEDHLSALFGTISNMCRDHFFLIREIFPTQFVARVTRLLIQRMFHDPAFGIQTRIELMLSSKLALMTGRQALSLLPQQLLSASQDYLDALCNVREKLTGLFTILMEHCVHPALLGLGSESVIEIYQFKEGAHLHNQRRGSHTSDTGRERLASQGSIGDESSYRTGDDQSHSSANNLGHDEVKQLEFQKSESDIRRFLEDQVTTDFGIGVLCDIDSALFAVDQSSADNAFA
jgi:hypothetical protein